VFGDCDGEQAARAVAMLAIKRVIVGVFIGILNKIV
jgi:hypothetical protein